MDLRAYIEEAIKQGFTIIDHSRTPISLENLCNTTIAVKFCLDNQNKLAFIVKDETN